MKNPYLPDVMQDYYEIDGGYMLMTVDMRSEPYIRTREVVKEKPLIKLFCKEKAQQWYKENNRG